MDNKIKKAHLDFDKGASDGADFVTKYAKDTGVGYPPMEWYNRAIKNVEETIEVLKAREEPIDYDLGMLFALKANPSNDFGPLGIYDALKEDGVSHDIAVHTLLGFVSNTKVAN